MVCNWILYSVNLVNPEMRKIAKFTKPKMLKITHNFFFENVENRATFVEGFRLEVYARGRFMKYSMSGIKSFVTVELIFQLSQPQLNLDSTQCDTKVTLDHHSPSQTQCH